MESSNKRGIIVGLFVFLGIAFLLAGVLLIGNLHGTFQRKMQVVTFFDDVNGLQKGNNVWFSGVKIGTVNEIDFYNQSKVKVTVNIETASQEYIRKDAKIKISTDGLIGNKILVIVGGSPEVRAIASGDTLKVEKTVSSEEMLDLLQENNKNVFQITNDLKTISGAIARGEGSLGKILKEDDLYNNINGTVVGVQNVSREAQRMVATLNAFAKKLTEEGGLANDLVTDTTIMKTVRASLAEVQQIADSAGILVNNLKQASNDPNSTLGVLMYDHETGTDVKKTIENLEQSSIKLEEDLEALQHNFLFRRYFKKKEKAERKAAEN